MAASCQRLVGLTAIVTGSGAGIGRAIAQRFAQEGAKIAVVDRDLATAEETAAAIVGMNGQAQAAKIDVATSSGARETVEFCKEAFGSVDLVVNNAAAFHFNSLEASTDEDWERVFRTNVMGYSNMIKAAIPELRRSTAPSVVNIASVSSFVAQHEMFIYNSSKGAIAQLTRCLAWDFAKENIRINAICPGSIETPAAYRHMDALGISYEQGRVDFGADAPMKRMGQPEEVASVAAFLASADASFMTGAMLVVDGGATLD